MYTMTRQSSRITLTGSTCEVPTMSVPFGPLVVTLNDVTPQIRRTFEPFTDPRQGKNTRYTLVDAGLSAFSVFFMQSPSFLEYQRRLEQAQGKNNAQTLFGVQQIPSANQIRHLLDATELGRVKPLFSYLFEALTQAGVAVCFFRFSGCKPGSLA